MKKTMFKKPKWLKPEINEPKYWVHVAVIIAATYGLMELYDPTGLSTFMMLIIFGAYFAIGDIITHTVLGLD